MKLFINSEPVDYINIAIQRNLKGFSELLSITLYEDQTKSIKINDHITIKSTLISDFPTDYKIVEINNNCIDARQTIKENIVVKNYYNESLFEIANDLKKECGFEICFENSLINTKISYNRNESTFEFIKALSLMLGCSFVFKDNKILFFQVGANPLQGDLDLDDFRKVETKTIKSKFKIICVSYFCPFDEKVKRIIKGKNGRVKELEASSIEEANQLAKGALNHFCRDQKIRVYESFLNLHITCNMLIDDFLIEEVKHDLKNQLTTIKGVKLQDLSA